MVSKNTENLFEPKQLIFELPTLSKCFRKIFPKEEFRMLKHIRFFVSAALVTVLLISTLFLSKPISIKACPPPPPDTLLSLYLKSDLIVVADVKSEEDGKIMIDEKDYQNIEVNRNLRVLSVLKGKTAKNFIYTRSEYRDKAETAENVADETEGEYYPYGYRGNSKLTVGEKYLLFFVKDAETAKIELTDSVSGAKKLNDYDLGIHQKRIGELKEIIEKKENQIASLTEWLIRCLEESSTRWDGAYDLTASFEAVEDKEESEEAKEIKRFVIDEDFYSRTPEIAENLTDSQKNYISSIYFSSIQNGLYKDDADNFYYSLSNLVSHWDKSRIVMYAYNILQSVDKSDSDKIGQMMNYISTIIGDEQLNEISSGYAAIGAENNVGEVENEESEASEADETEYKIEETGEIEETETVQNAERIESVKKIEQVENVQSENTKENKKETAPQTEKLTPAQMREKILQDFTNRYVYLLARGFAVENENENELAEINQK